MATGHLGEGGEVFPSSEGYPTEELLTYQGLDRMNEADSLTRDCEPEKRTTDVVTLHSGGSSPGPLFRVIEEILPAKSLPKGDIGRART
jgi:hypothetical protein